MNRRSYLVAAGATITSLSGCVSLRDLSGGDDGDAASGSGTPSLSVDNDAYRDGFEPGGAWGIHRFDATRQVMNPATIARRDSMGAAWLRTPLRGQRTFRTTPPVTDARRVYVGSGAGADDGDTEHNGFVAAFDGETGTRAQRTTVTTGSVDAVAHAGDEVLAVGRSPDRPRTTPTALAATDEAEQWRVEVPPTTGGPVVTDRRAHLASHEAGLTAVAPDGTRQWTRSVDRTDDSAATAPCATGATVFVGTERGRVVALTADSGDQQWDAEVVTDGHRPRIQSTPTVAGETVFVTGTDYRLYAVDATDNTIRWRRTLLDDRHGNAIPSVAVAGETVYVNTIHGGLIALQRDDGRERWRTGDSGSQPPAATGELILAPNGGTVDAYTPDGQLRWSFEMPAFDAGMAAYIMNPRIALAHNRAYISLNDGRVFSLESA